MSYNCPVLFNILSPPSLCSLFFCGLQLSCALQHTVPLPLFLPVNPAGFCFWFFQLLNLAFTSSSPPPPPPLWFSAWPLHVIIRALTARHVSGPCMTCMDAKDRECSDLDIVQLDDDPQHTPARCLLFGLIRTKGVAVWRPVYCEEEIEDKRHMVLHVTMQEMSTRVCGKSWFNMCTFYCSMCNSGAASPSTIVQSVGLGPGEADSTSHHPHTRTLPRQTFIK